MPTIITDAYATCFHEVSDVDPSSPEQIYNKVGLRSHAPCQNLGRYGYHIEGLRLPQFAPAASEFFLDTEGMHVRCPQWTFKPNIPQGATITEAKIKIIYGMGIAQGDPPVQGFIKWRMYGVLEPNYLPRQIETGSGYDTTAKTEHWWQFGYARRYRVDSYENHKRHTESCCYWQTTLDWLYSDAAALPIDIPFSGVGSLVEVIQEIVDLPGWAANNRMCLIMTPDHNVHSTDNVNSFGGAGDAMMNEDWCAAWGKPLKGESFIPYLTVSYT